MATCRAVTGASVILQRPGHWSSDIEVRMSNERPKLDRGVLCTLSTEARGLPEAHCKIEDFRQADSVSETRSHVQEVVTQSYDIFLLYYH